MIALAIAERPMSEGLRLLCPDRVERRWQWVDLDSQLPPDHRARLVWAFVESCELAAFYAPIKVRDEHPGRPASDPAVLLGLWLYATLDGIGSARAVTRLCQEHAAYRWLCGGVPANHDMLAAFRREGGERLDALLTQSLTGLIAEGLISLEEVAIDGTKVRARAGQTSLAERDRLDRIEAQVAARVTELKRAVSSDPAAAARQQQQRRLRAAEERAERIARAQQRLTVLQQEKAERAKQDKREAKRSGPKVSISDPEVRQMRMPDGAVKPAWNVQVATANGFVIGIEPTERRNDSGLAPGLVAQVEQRCGGLPQRLLADATAMTIPDIATLGQQAPDLQVYSPLPQEGSDITPGAARNKRSQRRREPDAVQQWRERMASEAGKDVYRRRKLTEQPHAQMKNRGFGRMPVHGRRGTGVVCFLHALAHNLLHAFGLRQAAA
jgi:transposase